MNEQQFATKYRNAVREKLRERDACAVVEYKVSKQKNFNFKNFRPAQLAVINSILSGKDVYHKIEDAGMSPRFVDAVYFDPRMTLPVLVVWYDKVKEARMYFLSKELMKKGEVKFNQGKPL